VRSLSRADGRDPGAPELRGQQRAYLEQQLQAFKSGNRHNDVSEQMRNVARQLTGEEIACSPRTTASFAARLLDRRTPCSASNSTSGIYATFAHGGLAGFAGVMIYIWIAGLPGRIALARNHPEAEAVKIMGWAGLLPTILPWIQASSGRSSRRTSSTSGAFRGRGRALDEERSLNDRPAPEHDRWIPRPPATHGAAGPPHGGTKG
jgi:hypothetical protein